MQGVEVGSSNLVKESSVENQNWVVQVEARLKPIYTVPSETIKRRIRDVLEQHANHLPADSLFESFDELDTLLADHVDRIMLCEIESFQAKGDSPEATKQYNVHTYYNAPEDDVEELMAIEGEAEDQNQDDTMAATVMELPNAALEGVWTSLIFADDVKQRLLNYIQTTLIYSDANVDFNIISWNRLVLLHGPPGTGKTSLCRALAQKLAVRLSDRFSYGRLIEINSHSLFSKWFSESGKLVQRLFSLVSEMVADEDALIVILIDEVESLTAARSAAASGSEPSDAIRVVNALLTQLDKLKTRKNCLVITTSNLSQTIDDAFLDRADIKQYIGAPPPQAIYGILRSCVVELMRVGLVESFDILTWDAVREAGSSPSDWLARLALQCIDMSGRTLRKLPVLAHARCISTIPQGLRNTGAADIWRWLNALETTIADFRQSERSKGKT